MKTKTCISTCALIAASATMTHADLTYTAPGMTTPYVTTQLNQHRHADIGTFWKYIVTGYNYQSYAVVPDGGNVSVDELRYKTGSSTFPGSTTVRAKINGQLIFENTLNTSSYSGTTGLVSHTYSSPIIIENAEIDTGFR